MKGYIGVIDSGVGGLNILDTLRKHLPNEDFIFVGDNANVPYGSKTSDELKVIGVNIAKYLEKQGVKMIVIACNTLSLNAIDSMREAVKIPIYGIARPTCKRFSNTNSKSVLVLATQATINTNGYLKFIKDIDSSIVVYQKAAVKLVTEIEANNLDHIDDIIKEYVNPYLNDIEAIILGCTHYPIIMNNFKRLYPNLNIIDSNDALLQLVSDKLKEHNLLNNNSHQQIVVVQATKSIDQMKKAALHFFNFDNVKLLERSID